MGKHIDNFREEAARESLESGPGAERPATALVLGVLICGMGVKEASWPLAGLGVLVFLGGAGLLVRHLKLAARLQEAEERRAQGNAQRRAKTRARLRKRSREPKDADEG